MTDTADLGEYLDSFVVAPRFCGPPRSANGGYLAGRVAPYVRVTDDEPHVEVTLRKPPPLGVPLAAALTATGEVSLAHGGTLLATARATRLAAPPPPPVGFDDAQAAAARYAGLVDHPFPTCFVCGLDRADGDGLRLAPGSVTAGSTTDPLVAAAWRPHPSLTEGADEGADGERLAARFVWAALDCPGGWSTSLAGRPMVLGRMAANVLATPVPGRRCVVMGQLRGRDGRKAFTASALYSADGELLAHAEATWFEVDPSTLSPAPTQ